MAGVAGASSSAGSPAAAGEASASVAGAGGTDTNGVGTAGNEAGGAPSAGAASGAFVHPGILNNRAMLDFVKAKIAAGAEPWKSALAKASTSRWGKLDYEPHPREIVECGSYSNPNFGCSDELNDALAAYTHALIWAYTDEPAHAAKAIAIMNAWSGVLKDHTNSNAPLQSAWAAQVWPRAAEIARHTSTSWPEPEVARFRLLLTDVYLPKIEQGSAANGNWELSMIEGLLNIAVFTDDRPLFEQGLRMWRERVPAYAYLEKDGPTPVPPPRGNKQGAALLKYWYEPGPFTDGLAQETCRDFGHVQMGFAGILNSAETALIQGVDLYAEESERLTAALEFHAAYLNGAAVPSSLCGGALTDVNPDPMWEIALNHFVTRRGGSLPETERVVVSMRPTGTSHHMAWETLTHAGLGTTGVK
jgi:hypothetical protein